MSFIAVTIEYVLAGLLSLCIFILPFIDQSTSIPTADGFFFIAAGLAYMLGIVADRIAEHVLDPADKYEKLRATGLLDPKKRVPTKDPLPLERIITAIRQEGHGKLEWHDQLRSRVRVTRNLLVYGPWALLALWVHSIPTSIRWSLPVVASAVIAYQTLAGLWFIPIPKTYEFVNEVHTDDLADGFDASQRTAQLRRTIGARRWFHMLSQLAGPGVAFLYLLCQPWDHWLSGVGYWGLGCVLWAATMLAWTRITRTFFGYVRSTALADGGACDE